MRALYVLKSSLVELLFLVSFISFSFKAFIILSCTLFRALVKVFLAFPQLSISILSE